jgi:holo-[acyl-carrier protein] synthase
MQIIAHGVDVVDIPRIEAMLAEHGDRFPERCFTDGERAYAESAGRLRPERYAVRFACKEAVLKALGTGWRAGISWRDIEVRRAPSGQPHLSLEGRCAELAREMKIRRWVVSLSHAGTSALASVIACG